MIAAPSRLDSFLGKPSGALLALMLTVYSAWYWSTQARQHGDAWVYPVLGVVTCWQCGRARKRVQAFREYRARWDAMGGDAPQGDAPGGRARARTGGSGRIGQTIVLCLLWAFSGAWLAVIPGSDPKTPYAVALFLGLAAWGAVAAARGLARRGLRAARERTSPEATARRAREHIVTVCIKARGSPSRAHSVRALPKYCRELLAQRTDGGAEP